jgi:predicted small lipoprotein YifL
MWRLIKVLLVLAVLAGIALVAYAYVGPFVMPDDFQAPVRDVTQPVDLDIE